jgi:UDP-2,3-diacylglucosamine hydrolase
MKLRAGDILFVSDVHLGGYNDDLNLRIEDKLVQLIHYATRNRLRIIILGDLFDYWMEYRGRAPHIGNRILFWFRRHHQENPPTVLITGNHDNWTGPLLPSAGFNVIHEYLTEEIGGRKVLMLHGDGVKDPSIGLPRPPLHRLLRNRYFIAVYQFLLPPAAGIWLTRMFSRISRFMSRFTVPGVEQIDTWAMQTLETSAYDVILCGHHHSPRFLKAGGKTYINTGNFFEAFSLAVYTNGEFHLVRWSEKGKPRPLSKKERDESERGI